MDKVLKQRLVGAAILIALAVIFVPMLFDGRDGSEGPRDLAIDLPPPPADRREVRRLPLNPADVSEPRSQEPSEWQQAGEPTASNPDRTDGPEMQPEPAEPTIVPQPSPTPEVPANPDPEPGPSVAEQAPEPASEPIADRPAEPRRESETAGLPDGDWQVQVASFSSVAAAERVSAQLDQLGHAAGVELVVRGETRLHRVWTGPYADRAAAERARAQIAATVAGVEPLVLSVAGTGGESESTPPGSGYAVQVGSFAEQSNADRQRSQLLERGFDAFIHADQTGSRPIWRVRVGLFPTRDEASALQRTLREQAGLEGLVVSHP